jgi:hypothetical protein
MGTLLLCEVSSKPFLFIIRSTWHLALSRKMVKVSGQDLYARIVLCPLMSAIAKIVSANV